MGNFIVVYGKSGSGKSTSLEHFGADEILLINVMGKLLPFRNRFKYVVNGGDVGQIVNQMTLAVNNGIKTIVLDDVGYIQTQMFMSRHRNMKGNQSFELYNDIADTMWNLINLCRKFPNDVNVYFLFHEDTNDFGTTQIKTIGKLLDSKVCIEGMATIVLRCMSKDGEHFIRTVTDGSDLTKAPRGMFDADEVPNDLKMVDDKIRDFYGTQIEQEVKK
mgnify:CR=1 FL=1